MEKHAKIYVAGHTGLVGSALCRQLETQGYTNLLHYSFQELDLRDPHEVDAMFARERPDYVLLAAAKVGGIHANSTYPADFICDNLTIQTNVLQAAWRSHVKRLLFLGSSCIYPRDCPQPIKEEYLLTGPLEKTNEPYAIAKIAGLVMADSFNRQHGTEFISVMPTNLYGPNDNYDPLNSHVLPGLIRRFHEAKVAGRAAVEVWGTGKPRREFLYSDDMAAASVFLMNQPKESLFAHKPLLFNIGCGEDVTIAELATIIARVVGFSGRLEWDASKPDGTPRKWLDVGRMTAMGWRPKVKLEDGIRTAYEDFCRRHGAGASCVARP